MRHCVDHVAPDAAAGLAKETHCRVPGGIGALPHPSPFSVAFQSYPDGSRQSARKMRDRRVAGDDQIAMHHRGGRVDERIGTRVEIGAKRFDPHASRKTRKLLLAVTLLERDEPDAGKAREGRQRGKRERASAIRLGIGIALPHHTNLKSGRSDALGPKLLLPRFRRQIGDIAGNRVEPGFERSRQAAEGNLRIERLRRWRAVDETDRNAGREEAAQSRRADKCNIHTCAHHQGQVAKELNRVAEPVVVEHKDSLAGLRWPAPRRKAGSKRLGE